MEQRNKHSLGSALKILGISLPLLFAAPVVMTIGFKAVSKDDNYLLIIVGVALGILAISLAALGIVRLSNYLFQKDNGNS